TFSDASKTPQPGSFGGSLGYAQQNNGDAGFNGGWVGIGIDEYGNFSNATEGRQGGPGLRPDAVTVRGSGSGGTGYNFIATTGTLTPGIDISGSTPGPAHRYRITLDSRMSGVSNLTVERDARSGAGYQVLLGPINMLAQPGQAAVPQNLYFSVTGSTGGSTNIHELDSFQVCAAQMNPVAPLIDHFEILHDGGALTCAPEEVTVRACKNASCSEIYTDPVTVTLAPATGWVGGNVKALNNGIGTFALRRTTVGTLNLGVTDSEPTAKPLSINLCRAADGGATTSCTLSFAASGFVFEVPDMPANKPSNLIQDVRVRAVKVDDVSQQCVPAFQNASKSVSFWSEYVAPGAGGRPVSRAV